MSPASGIHVLSLALHPGQSAFSTSHDIASRRIIDIGQRSFRTFDTIVSVASCTNVPLTRTSEQIPRSSAFWGYSYA